MVKAIVEVARGLGKEVIAEGVEDEQTFALLREHGVPYVQGYLFGPPAPVEELLGTRLAHRGSVWPSLTP